MTAERLSLVAPDVAGRIKDVADERRLRLAARRAAGAVVERAGVSDRRVDAALDALGNGTTDEELRKAVVALVDELDETYWDLQEEHEAGRASQTDCLRAFGRARAVAAVACALDPDPVMVALEATYEAHCAFDDGLQVIATVSAILS